MLVRLGTGQEALRTEVIRLRPPAGVVMYSPGVDDDAGACRDTMPANLRST
jgi:hypothetical protein